MGRFAAPINLHVRLSLLLAGLIVSAPGQAEPPRELQGQVVSARSWSADLPVAGARVRLEDSSTEAVTDGNGFYQLPLPAGSKPGDPLTLTVTFPGYVIYEPAGGRTKVPADPPANLRIDASLASVQWSRVTVRMLRKGSAALLEDPQVEALLSDLSAIAFKAEELQDALPSEAPDAAPFERELEDWAASRGLPYEQVDRRVRAWSEETFAHRGGGLPARQGEAALGMRHYEEAGSILASAAAARRQEAAQRHNLPLEEVRKALSERLALYARSAAARDSAGLFEEARQVALQGVEDAQAEVQRHPQDPELRRLWWGSSLVSVYQHWRSLEQAAPPPEAPVPPKRPERPDRQQRQSAASGVLAECRALRAQIPKDAEPRLWAWSNLLVAVITGYLGEVSEGKPALDALDQAIADAGSGAAFYGKDRDPASWAAAQTVAGRLMHVKAEQALTDDSLPASLGPQLLAQSRAALLPVLEVYSQQEHPRQWGEVRRLLARGAYLQARSDPGQLAGAEVEIRAALLATNPDTRPNAWADMQDLFGQMQQSAARLAQGAAAAARWRTAVKAFSLAANHRLREREPLRWAGSEEQLAGALEGAAGAAVDDNEASVLLERAVEAYRQTLSVLDREQAAAQWERVQAGLARVLAQKAAREGRGHLGEAGPASRQALQVFRGKVASRDAQFGIKVAVPERP